MFLTCTVTGYTIGNSGLSSGNSLTVYSTSLATKIASPKVAPDFMKLLGYDSFKSKSLNKRSTHDR